MPRVANSARSEILSTGKSRGFYAAAKTFDVGKSSRSTKPKESGEAWQREAWDFYDLIPEYHYAVNWVGNLLSRARLTVTKNGKLVDPANDRVASEALSGFFGGPDGQAEMFRQFGIHYTVAGEGYILGVDEGEADSWYVVAATEITKSGGVVRAWGEDLEGQEQLLLRIWRPHPRFYKKSDSPSRAVLGTLSEILKLTMHVAAQLDSRLASAGILFLPSEIDFGGQQVTVRDPNTGQETTKEVEGVEGFADLLSEVASTAIKNRASAAALVPIIVQVPTEALEKVHHLTFWSGLDENAESLRNEAIGRLGLGMDMPPEVLTGVGDMNHWGAWQVDEAAIKSHSEPLLQALVSSLTRGYLRGLAESILAEENPDWTPDQLEAEVDSYAFSADTTQMRMRPNRSKESIELYQMGELSGKTMRAENGFSEEDVMGEEERKEWFRAKVASGSTTPELVEAALKELGVLVQFEAKPEPGSERKEIEVPKDTQEARPDPSTADHPYRGVPRESTLLAASEVLVYSALKRAGNKLKNSMQGMEYDGDAADRYLDGRLPAITASAADQLLDGSWDALEKFDYQVPQHALRSELHSYTKSLLTTRTPINRRSLAIHLASIKEPTDV